MSYNALIEDIVGAQENILGDAAIDIGQQVDGLTVTGEGVVQEVNRDGVAIVDDLVSAYVDELGAAAVVTLKPVASDYADDLELPGSLE